MIAAGIDFAPGFTFDIGNTVYGFNDTISFNNVDWDADGITYDNITIETNSDDTLYLNISEAPFSSYSGSDINVLRFNASTSTGTAYFNISTLTNTNNYSLYVDNVFINTYVPAVGVINFSYASFAGDELEFIITTYDASGGAPGSGTNGTSNDGPILNLTAWCNEGFNIDDTGYFYVNASDDHGPTIDVQITLVADSTLYYSETIINGLNTSTYSWDLANDGLNYFYIKGTNSDGISSWLNTTFAAYYGNITLINEINHTLWDQDLNTRCVATVPEKNYYYDMKAADTAYLEYVSSDPDAIRFEISFNNEVVVASEVTHIDRSVGETFISQTGAWTILDNDNIIVGTVTIYNLTGNENTSQFNINYTDGTIQGTEALNDDDLFSINYEYGSEEVVNYYDNETNMITRYLNIGLVEHEVYITIGDANQDENNGVERDYYEQVIYSARRRPFAIINMNNTESNPTKYAYICADYTRFAYGGYKAHFAYTVDALYYLYTYDNDSNKILLAGIDGGKASEINLDALTFSAQEYDFNILGSNVGFQKVSDYTIKIYYYNQNQDNERVKFEIFEDTNLLFDYSESTTPNELTIYFDYSTLTLTSGILKLRVTEFKINGDVETNEYYFSQEGSAGIIDARIACFMAILIGIFSLTFVATKYVFNFFGFIGLGIGIVITALASQTWYIHVTQAVLIILLIFTFLIYKEEYAGAV